MLFQLGALLLARISPTCGQLISAKADASVINACNTVSHQFPAKISFPGNDSFVETVSSYYTLQEQFIQPFCIISPNSTQDVSEMLRIITSRQAKFAVKSGGHMMNAGAANIDSGVVIDLRSMKTITANVVDMGAERATIVSIGAGARWGEVYSYLDPLKLATMGGRVSDIGVAGLTLGGGISFFSQQRGWVSENVQNFEIVLASGEILKTSAKAHPDLFQALKFGSNNFGIVTRIDILGWVQEDYLGGSIVSSSSTTNVQLEGFAKLLETRDPYVATILSFGWISASNSTFVNTQLAYTKPGVTQPDVLKPFVEVVPQFVNTMRVGNTSAFAEEAWVSFPRDNRYQWVTTTFTSSLPLIQKSHALWLASLPSISEIPNLSWLISLQPLPPNLSNSTHLSPSVMGSSTFSSPPFVLVNIGYNWLDAQYDDTLKEAAKKLVSDIEKEAKKEGKWVEFKYLNYATAWQDPLGSYGERYLGNLREVSKKYDQKRVFQNLCPGGFKVLKAGGGGCKRGIEGGEVLANSYC